MEELIKLCKHEDIGFESSFLYNRPYKFSSKEELRKLFWLTELRQFIYKKFNIYIVTTISSNDGRFMFFWVIGEEVMTSKLTYDNETLALEAALLYFINNYINND